MKFHAAINTLHFIFILFCDSRNWLTEYEAEFYPKPPLISNPPYRHLS